MTIVIRGTVVPSQVLKAGYRLNSSFRGFTLQLCGSVEVIAEALGRGGTLLAIVPACEAGGLMDAAETWGTFDGGRFAVLRGRGERWGGRRSRRLRDFEQRVGVERAQPEVGWHWSEGGVWM